MSEDNKEVVTKEVNKEVNKELATKDEDKWCWTRISETQQRNRNNKYKCCSEVLQILIESCCAITSFIVGNILGTFLLIIGIIYINDCPIAPAIPASLIAFGVLSLVFGITSEIVNSKCFDLNNKRDGFATLAKLILWISGLGALLALFFASVQVYGIYSEVTFKKTEKDSKAEYYCNYFLYSQAFIFVTIMILFITIVMIFMCCLFIMIATTDGLPETPQPEPTVVVIHHFPESSD